MTQPGGRGKLRDMTELPSHAVGTIEGYDRWAATYDRYPNPLIALEEPVTRGFLGDVAGSEVLDLACGTGRHALPLALRGARVTGVDASTGMLERAREADVNGAVRWIHQDLTDGLPFDDSRFDHAVHALALDHLPDHCAVLRELARVVRPGGRVAVSVMHPAMFLKGTQARFVDEEQGELVVIDSHRFDTAGLVMASLAAGFVIDVMREDRCTAELAERIPRAAKYVDWPMLLFLGLRAPGK